MKLLVLYATLLFASLSLSFTSKLFYFHKQTRNVQIYLFHFLSILIIYSL